MQQRTLIKINEQQYVIGESRSFFEPDLQAVAEFTPVEGSTVTKVYKAKGFIKSRAAQSELQSDETFYVAAVAGYPPNFYVDVMPISA